MNFTAEPQKTYALVAGIGHYAIGDPWKLPNAGKHAADFVKWLRDNNVPADNIRLFLSGPDGDAYQGDVQALEATQQVFSDVLDNQVPNWSGDLLYIFWAGHGNIGEQSERILFFEDWQEFQHHRHLDFTNLMERLRRVPLGGAFRWQVAYVDACANAFESVGFEGKMGSATVGLNALVPGVRQVFFLAADSGQQAQAGALSALVLAALRVPPWPPNPDDVINAVRPKFDDAQRPVRLAWRNATGDEDGVEYRSGDLPGSRYVNAVEATRGFPVRHLRALSKVAAEAGFDDVSERDSLYKGLCAAAGIVNPPTRNTRLSKTSDLLHIMASAFDWRSEGSLVEEFRRVQPAAAPFESQFLRTRLLHILRQELLKMNVALDEFRQIYHLATVNLSDEPGRRNARTLNEMLDELCMPTSGPEQYLSLYEFVLRTAERFPERQPQLEAFVEAYASPALAETARERIRQERRFQLRISVEPDPDVENGLKSVDAMLFVSGTARPVRRWREPATEWDAGVAAAVKSIVRRGRETVIREYGRKEADLDVEVLVSWPFFMRAADQIQILPPPQKKTLGQMHPAVLRWRERWLARWDVDCEKWIEAGKRLLETMDKQGVVVRVDPGKAGAAAECCGLAALAFCPGDENALEDLYQVIEAAPFVAWLRQTPADWSVYIDALAALAKSCDLRDMPKAVRQARTSANAPDIASHLTLFWDDPNSAFEWRFNDVSTGS